MSSASAYERISSFVNEMLTFDVEPEAWRKLEVSIGGPLAHAPGDFCDNSITTHKYNALTFVPRSLFEQFRRTANQRIRGVFRASRAARARAARVRFRGSAAGTFCSSAS